MKHLAFLIFVLMIFVQPAIAQEVARPDSFSAKAVAQNASTLLTSRFTVSLWGIDVAHLAGTPLALHGRVELDDLMGGQPVRCDVVGWRNNQPSARCTNAQNIDLALSLLQQGYVVVDRQSVLGTAYEEPYVTAEETAKSQGNGIWSDGVGGSVSMAMGDIEDILPLVGIIVGSACVVLIVLAILILYGFGRVEKLLKRSMAMTRAQEDRMRKREKFVTAAMLEGELLANKGKIEAFLVINRDMMEGLMSAKANNRLHKYQESTEIVQKTPILSRSVFEGNTDKLELLGSQFAKEIVDLYNDIHSESDYLTLQKDMPIEDAINHTQKIILEAEQLLDPIDQLINGLRIILSDRKRPQISRIKDEDLLAIDD